MASERLKKQTGRWRCTISLLWVFAAPLLACDPEKDPSTTWPHYVLEEVTQYGWASLADSTRELTDKERKAGAGVLGHPADVAEGPNGEVYVVDTYYQKVVVFKPEGDYERLILGGPGRGPGEFLRPRSLAVDPFGRIWVFDQLANRLTEFSPSGELIRVVPTLPLLDLAATSDYLYGTLLKRDDAARVAVFDTTGILVDTILRPGSDDTDAGMPSAGAIGPGVGDAIVFAYPRVGRWRRVTSNSEGVVGGEVLHPSSRTTSTRLEGGGVRVSIPVEVWSAGELPGGLTFIYYARQLEDEAERTFWLVLFDPVGVHLQTLKVQADGGSFGHSLIEPDIFIRRDDPVPRIVRLRLRPSAG